MIFQFQFQFQLYVYVTQCSTVKYSQSSNLLFTFRNALLAIYLQRWFRFLFLVSSLIFCLYAVRWTEMAISSAFERT